MSVDRVIYVCGAPCSGTSMVAGVLHRLGVDMGEGHFIKSIRPYETYEDARCAEYKAEPTELQKFIMGEGRDFRAYLEMRLEEANRKGTIPGVKIGSAYWLNDPAPETLPVRVVWVVRRLHEAIASDFRYRRLETPGLKSNPLTREVQMAGYYYAAQRIYRTIKPAYSVAFEEFRRNPLEGVFHLNTFALGRREISDVLEAVSFVKPL